MILKRLRGSSTNFVHFQLILIAFITSRVTVGAIESNAEPPILPVVLWHGMGDTCCLPFSLGSIKKLLQQELNQTYVKSLEIGGNVVEDYESGFFIHPNKQIRYVCEELAKDERLKEGYNAIGFSQGGQFLRALLQRCPQPPMKVLVSLGGQHQGIYGLPKCPSLQKRTCEYIRRLLDYAAYESLVQESLVQATYWHDPLKRKSYVKSSSFLADINNEVFENGLYADRLNSLDAFVLVKFMNDTIVQPKESSWFQFYREGQDREIEPLTESRVYDTLNLRNLHESGRLLFLEVEGDHLRVTREWFIEQIIPLLRPNRVWDNNTKKYSLR